ncbi:lipocalin family protein [Rhizobium sp. NPDC090275]|uniref:lipocalin family protein n=1 Tax=Rhizobium sp. NPDC090275 TaxID=3364498 RepID=UPI00383B876F
MKLNIAIMTMLAAGLTACSPAGPSGNLSVPQPKKPIELNRYLGHWFESARYENQFERGCEAVTADYTLRTDGMVRVLNTCREGGINGKRTEAEGKAKIVPDSRNAKLKVSFFGPFYADYWILDRAPDYSWSIVGEASGRYLWILTRSPKASEKTRKMLVEKARALGYDIAMLRWTQH